MGLFDDIVGKVKAGAAAVVGAGKTAVSAVKTAAVATGKAVSSTASTVTELFKGAQETVANYLASHDINSINGPEFTPEMRKQALKYGPVDSFAYRMQLSNLWLIKNPEAVVSIGSVGKAGTILTKVKGGGYLLDFAKKEAGALESAGAKGIKNIAGFATSQAKKVAASSGFKSIFQTTFGKILAVGGLLTGGTLAVTNTLDFYNWNGPIQTALKQKFPWLFPAVNNAKQGKKTNEIKRLTPAETKQLQQLFFEQTGVMYSGEDLRRLIFEEFGITVLEIAPTKGNTAGPLAAGGGVSFQQSIQRSTNIATIKPTPKYMIENQEDLEYQALNEIAAFVQALPSRMSFDFLFKKSYKDGDGVTRKGNFAFMRIKVTTKTGGQSTLAEIPLGTTPPALINPGQLNAGVVNNNIRSQLGAVVVPASLPAPGQTTPSPTPTAALPTQDVSVAEDGRGKYLALIPGVAGMTRERVYRLDGGQLRQYGLTINSTYEGLLPRIAAAGQIEESGFDFGGALAGRAANLRNQELNRLMDEVAKAHPYDTNYSEREKLILSGQIP